MRAVWLVMTKELRETLRDPHVIVFLAFPLVFYPLLLWGTTQLGTLYDGWLDRRGFVVDVQGPDALRAAVLEPPAVEGDGGLPALERGEVDVVVETVDERGGWEVTVHHVSARSDSAHAARVVRRRLSGLRDDRLDELAAAHGIPSDELHPLDIDTEDISTAASLGAMLMGTLFGFLGPFAMLIGGVYPAVDLVVGERERGSLETTLVAAVPRVSVLGGKLLACVALMVFATFANVGTLALTIAQIAVSLEVEIWYLPPLGQLLATVPTVVASAVFCAAALLLSMLPARTFKEGEFTASAALIPGIFPILAAMLALTAEQVSPWLWWLPLANTTLVLHDAVVGELTAWEAVLPALENGALGALLLVLGLRIVSREDYLIGGRLPRWLAWMQRGDPP